MAIRKPSGILVNGVGVWVRDPNAATGSVFATYQRVPGVGSITLPDEAAPQNDIVTIDGTVGAAGFSGVGTATIPLPVLGQHPAHRFLAATRRSGAAIQVRIVKEAIGVFTGTDVLEDAGTVDTGSSESGIAIAAAVRSSVVNSAREGMFVALSNTAPSGVTGTAYDATPSAATDAAYKPVLNIADDGSVINVAPDFSTDYATPLNLHVIQPGLRWDNIQCQVAQMGDGDFQSASVAAGNLVLRPNAELPLSDAIVGTTVATDGTVS